MKFSICIPNYNYERFLGKTVQSVLDQAPADFEILFSDNASTDDSLNVVRAFNDARIQIHVNAVNVGFSQNLDRAARMATGESVIMLSSDDLIKRGALTAYEALFNVVARECPAIVSSSWDVISGTDEVTGRHGPDAELWTAADRASELDALVGGPVYRVPGDVILKRCLLRMRNPFNFAATCYSRSLYDAVEGYGGGRLFGPDKWFHWRVLAKVPMAYFVDRELFCYRWHGSNQANLENAVGALKYLVDEYVSTLELDAGLLARAGLSRDEVTDAYVEHDIARHGLATLARGQRLRARQILDFGKATFPQHLRRNRKAKALKALLALGPLGQRVAARAYQRYQHASSPRNGQ